MEATLKRQTLFRRPVAPLAHEHGSWVFILSPADRPVRRKFRASACLVVAAMAAFLIRQPVTIAVKALSGRRSRRDLPAARFWIAVYGLVGLLGLAGLISLGFTYVLILAVPGIPVFAWHLYLVTRRAERRQAGVEIVGSGVLALAAPAAYWVGTGRPDPLGWWLFALVWFQSAASIVYAYLLLERQS
jgi:hypothetical protein